jgi:hypothetical protein
MNFVGRWALVLALFACGKKEASAPPAASEPASAAPVEAPTPDPPADDPPVAAAPSAPVSNANFRASLTRANGSTVSGKVVRVERGVDWYAEEGWADDAKSVRVQVEAASSLSDLAWADIARIDLTYSAARSDIDCQYDSNFTPWMYICTLRTTANVKTVDAKAWQVASRHKWRFTFEDGSQVEFYASKLPAREQDQATPGMDNVENYDLYGKLQARVLEDAKTTAVKSIVISK